MPCGNPHYAILLTQDYWKNILMIATSKLNNKNNSQVVRFGQYDEWVKISQVYIYQKQENTESWA